MTTPVSFEISRLLKEKRFDIPKNKMYCRSIPMFEGSHVVKFHNGDKHECSNVPHDWNNTESPVGTTTYYTAPTLAEVVMWLYDKYNIWVSVLCDAGRDELFTFKIYSTEIGKEKCLVNGYMHNSPTEAYESAIEYALNYML